MPQLPTASPGVWAAIAAAFRQNRLPCFVLNAVVIALVWSYYQWPAVAGLWEAVGLFKLRWSYVFSFVSAALAAAVFPFLVQWLLGTLPPHQRMQRLICLALFWGYRGVEIDLFYQLQAMLFGHGNDVKTLALKVSMDQFVYSTLWAVPTYLVVLRWIDAGFSWSRALPTLGGDFWKRIFPTVLITNWLVWIPAASLVYSLPAPLQFPLFSMVMCVFILIVTLLARGSDKQGDAPVAAAVGIQ